MTGTKRTNGWMDGYALDAFVPLRRMGGVAHWRARRIALVVHTNFFVTTKKPTHSSATATLLASNARSLSANARFKSSGSIPAQSPTPMEACLAQYLF